MTLSYWQRKHNTLTRDIKADILVIGGGFVGLSTAFWLTELMPESKIVLLERSTCGAGASGQNAGFLTKGSAYFYQSLIKKWGEDKAFEILEYARSSLHLLNQHVLSTSPEIKFQKTQSFTLLRNKADLELPARFEYGWKDSTELEAGFRTNFAGALTSEAEYRINPMELLLSLKSILTSRKVKIIEQNSAFQILDGRVVTEIKSILTDKVVLAMNGYSGEFHPALKSIISPMRAQMLAVELEAPMQQSALHYDPPERVYFRKTQDNTLIIGGKRLLDEKGEVGTHEKISPIVQAGLEEYLSQTLNLKYKVINRWSGIMGFTEHELPLVQKIAAPVATVIAAGFSGHGMGLGFHAGKEAAELILGTRDKSFFTDFNQVKIKL